MRLAGKIALITGTGGGQGREAAIAFARAGAKVIGVDLKIDGNRETVEIVQGQGGEMTGFQPVDLGDPDAAKAFVDAAADCYGGLDIIYNNASAARFAPFGELSVEDWRFTMVHELDLVFYVSRFSWPHLVARGGGVILNTASTAGMAATSVRTGAHAAAKAGVIGLTRQMALEGAPLGIRVVCLSPGPIATPGNADRLAANSAARAELENMTLLRRIGRPEEVACLALFLVSDDAAFITGTNYPIDGGMTAG